MHKRPADLERFFEETKELAPDTRALEQGFEQRVLARLVRETQPVSEDMTFFRMAWAAAPACAALLLVLVAYTLLSGNGGAIAADPMLVALLAVSGAP